jgi:hypothetical protein
VRRRVRRGGGAVGEALAWRWSTWCGGTCGGGAVGEATAWRRSAWHRGGRGGGAIGEAPTLRWSRCCIKADMEEERALTGVWQGNDNSQG